MKIVPTSYGRFCIGDREQVFDQTVAFMRQAQRTKCADLAIALTGGSTPKAFYDWAVRTGSLGRPLIAQATWYASDERFVPLDHGESNFGNAARRLLDPLEIDPARRHPWPTDCINAAEAAARFNNEWENRRGGLTCFDLCFLGMGDDCHTASLFPESPLIGSDIEDNFAAVEVPGKGWRLTITPAGLGRCRQIIVTVLGSGKQEALDRALSLPCDPISRPIQMLRHVSDRVIWLADHEVVEGVAALRAAG